MSTDNQCGLSFGVIKLEEIAELICYHIITPIYFFVGLFGNITLLIAFYKQSKTDGAYAYQVFLTLSKTSEIVAFSSFVVTFKLAAAAGHIDDRGGVEWFKKNYFLMFYVAHVVCVGLNVFITSSLFYTVAMTADRVFALAKPFVYKNIHHTRHQIVAATSCLALSLLLNVYDAWGWMILIDKSINQTDAVYVLRGNPDFVGTPLAMGLANFRTAVRLACVLALIILNVCMARSFGKQFKKVGQLTIGSQSDHKEAQRKKAEKTLLILTVYQSLLTTVSQVPHCAYYVAQFASIEFTRCWGAVLAPFVDGCIQICDAADFFVILAINKRMRYAILQVLPKFCSCGQNDAVTTITVGTSKGTSSNGRAL